MKEFQVYLGKNKFAFVKGEKVELKDDFFKIGDNYFRKDKVETIIKVCKIEDIPTPECNIYGSGKSEDELVKELGKMPFRRK